MMLLEVAQSSWLDQDKSHSLEMSKLAEEQNRHVKAEKWPWSDLSEITNCMANWSNRQKFEVRLLLDAFTRHSLDMLHKLNCITCFRICKKNILAMVL